jgi:hypothetical protein
MKVTRRLGVTVSVQLSVTELATIKNALNNALELSDSDYSTLMGGPKKRSIALLEAVQAALAKPTAKPMAKPKAR